MTPDLFVAIPVLVVVLAAIAVETIQSRRRPEPSRLLESRVSIPAGHPESFPELDGTDVRLAQVAELEWPDEEWRAALVYCPTPDREGQPARPSLLASRCVCGLFHPDRRRPRARRRRWRVWRRQSR